MKEKKMEEKKIKSGSLGYKYERKRINKEIKLPPLCKDYEPTAYGPYCGKAKLCKNATYSSEGKADGICVGGTDPGERETRRERLVKV